eukprot:COSAG05_NODE_6176_length_1008_cov_0.973597_1_plen_214_part_01
MLCASNSLLPLTSSFCMTQDDDPNTKERCDHHLIAGRQSGHQIDHSDVSSKQSSKSGAHNYGVGGCLNPYGNQICKCSASRKCEIDTEYPFSWVDIIGTGTGTKITKWIQNQDDGWFHVNIPWGFPWFGKVEHKITIGTNGVITFGVTCVCALRKVLAFSCRFASKGACASIRRPLPIFQSAFHVASRFGRSHVARRRNVICCRRTGHLPIRYL